MSLLKGPAEITHMLPSPGQQGWVLTKNQDVWPETEVSMNIYVLTETEDIKTPII